jgi:predicted molibdopterin-dependent oxidoreductase YjgC
MHVILHQGLQDRDFIVNRTEGLDELGQVVEGYSPSVVENITGVPAELIVQAARMYATADSAGIFYAMGITQHVSGTDNVKALANLAMVTGNMGKESAGVNPLRGQNNVQGACDMGALPNVFPGYQQVADGGSREKFEKAWQRSLSQETGLTLVEMMRSAEEGKLKALYVLGEDPLLSDPNLSHIREAVERLELLVVQDLFLSETAKWAHVFLPGVSFAEKEGTFTNTERRVQRVRKAIDPPGRTRQDWRIIADLAGELGLPMDYGDPSEIMEEIARVTPSYGGLTYGRLEKDGGLQWPCPAKDHPGTTFLHKEKFTRGRGKFHAVGYAAPTEVPDDEYPLLLTTGRVLYHWHTGNLSRHSESLSSIYPEGFIEINPRNAQNLGLIDGDLVDVRSRRGSIRVKAEVTERTPEGVVFMTFHFAEAAVNLLTIDALDPVAKIPELKVCAVDVRKCT